MPYNTVDSSDEETEPAAPTQQAPASTSKAGLMAEAASFNLHREVFPISKIFHDQWRNFLKLDCSS
jgi:hypothetical protein